VRQHGWQVLVLLGLGVCAGVARNRAEAQLEPIGVRPRTLRIELRGNFESYDQQFLAGTKRDLGADYSRAALGADFFPSLAATDARLARLTGQSGYQLNLGAQTVHAHASIGTGTIGLGPGLTKMITLYADIPIVESRVQSTFRLDSTAADAGFNPSDPIFGTGAGQSQAALFFQEFTSALDTLSTRITSGFYDANPGQKAQAQAALATGTQLYGDLFAVTSDPATQSPFLPTATSAAGTAISGQVTSLQTELNTLGVAGFQTAPVLAGARLASGDIERFIANPAGPIGGFFPITDSRISRLGDIELGTVLTLVDRWDRKGRGGFRFAARGGITLPTGQLDREDQFFDLGTGTGRNELSLGGIADVGSRSFGVRLEGGYLRRFPQTRVRRLSPPTQPIADRTRLTRLRLDAGDVVNLGARPFFRLASSIALTGVVQYWNQGEDQAQYKSANDSLPNLSASLLVQDSKRSAWLVGGGISYASRAARGCEGKGCGLPIDATWSYEEVIHASGGRVPASKVSRIAIRFYQRLW